MDPWRSGGDSYGRSKLIVVEYMRKGPVGNNLVPRVPGLLQSKMAAILWKQRCVEIPIRRLTGTFLMSADIRHLLRVERCEEVEIGASIKPQV